jgi:hypothetical protein
MKHKKGYEKVESIYDKSIRELKTSDKNIFKELDNYLNVDHLPSKQQNIMKNILNLKNSNNVTEEKINYQEGRERITDGNLISKSQTTLGYLPKRNIKFTPSNLLSYINPNALMKSFKGEENSPNQMQNNQLQNLLQNDNKRNNNTCIIKTFVKNSVENEFLSFKTNFILKFARNIEIYEKFIKYFDQISENNKKIILDSYHKLKSLADKKDRILFDSKNMNNLNMETNLEHWKDCIVLFYEFEYNWLRSFEIALKEFKTVKDENIHLTKKVSDQENIILIKDNEIKYLNTFIEENDINYKALVKKKRMKDLNQIKDDYEKKEKMNVINVFRLEEE